MTAPTLNFTQARFNMIEQQIRPWNVLDSEILELLGTMRRENFVAPAHQALAYADLEIPLADGQCMLAPRLEARLLQDLAVQKNESVLEIGAGSGFMAALLAQRARHVLTLEISPTLAQLARKNLQHAAITNVEVRHADGSAGASADGPFDVILLSGSVSEVPPGLLEQLRVGGRLAAITGDEPVMCASIYTCTGPGAFVKRTPWDVNAPRLQNFAEHSEFIF